MLRIRQLLLLYPLCPLHDALPILRHLLLLDPQLGPLLELDTGVPVPLANRADGWRTPG